MTSLLFAYGFIWLLIFAYMLFVQRKQASLEREMEMIRELTRE